MIGHRDGRKHYAQMEIASADFSEAQYVSIVVCKTLPHRQVTAKNDPPEPARSRTPPFFSFLLAQLWITSQVSMHNCMKEQSTRYNTHSDTL
jgi:hypothetical protein